MLVLRASSLSLSAKWYVVTDLLIRTCALVGTDTASPRQLQLAIKPPYGPKDDAFLHGRLMALDLATAINSWSAASAEVYLDVDDHDDLQQPVNLNIHHHEELAARTPEELEDYYQIIEEPYHQRVEDLRLWYRRCIDSLQEHAAQKGNSVHDLDLDWLCEEIKAANKVMFFGGSSLSVLDRLIDRGVANRLQCYLQAVRR